MIVIPICLKCENLKKDMKCSMYPNGIPKEILSAQKTPEEICKEYEEHKK